jgi:ABC-type branched-subunit amino acid transport system permease subunit
LFGASEINILGMGVITVLALMYFPNGIVGPLRERTPAAVAGPGLGSGAQVR